MKVWQIDNDDFIPIDVKILAPDQVYLIPDAEKKKIFIWAGKDCPKVKLYKAGTLATKFKSVGKFYGYEIEKVDESIEPAKFLMEAESTQPAPAPMSDIPQQARSAVNTMEGSSPQIAPAMTFDEGPEPVRPASSGDPLQQVLAELAEIKDLLGKIWQKVKNI